MTCNMTLILIVVVCLLVFSFFYKDTAETRIKCCDQHLAKLLARVVVAPF